MMADYITAEEVKRVCKDLKIRDWTKLKNRLSDFCTGLEVELEHGLRFEDANVTNNHPIVTGKIVIAHLKESLDYYQRLEVAELEGDLFKAVSAGDMKKAKGYYKRLAKARMALGKVESDQLK